jgi:hypothetical protein
VLGFEVALPEELDQVEKETCRTPRQCQTPPARFV